MRIFLEHRIPATKKDKEIAGSTRIHTLWGLVKTYRIMRRKGSDRMIIHILPDIAPKHPRP
jgi:hypothetical protein